MSRDLFRSLSGSLAAQRRLEVVANNVANVSTTGFQAGRVTFEALGEGEALDDGFAMTATIRPIRRPGPIEQTGNPTHVALEGPGYFAVQSGDETLLTRDGAFHVSPDGMLVNRDGLPVLSDFGAIVVPPGETVRITPQGEVLADETGPIATLARFDGALEHAGGNLWRSTGLLSPVETPVASGALEGSSVDPTAAMIELVEASRAFEMLQKAMQASDEMDAKLNQTGGA